jgi:hypothetical protein
VWIRRRRSPRSWRANGTRGCSITDLSPCQFWTGEDEWSCGATFGLAGANAALVAVESDGVVELRRIESPLRAFVAAFDGSRPTVVRVVADDGRVLATDRFVSWPGGASEGLG